MSDDPLAADDCMTSEEQPVLARAVTAAPSPLRFGLKAMLVFMAICSVQFALMNYLGILLGLILGVVACGFVLTLLIVAAIAFHNRHGTPWMDRLDQLAIRATIALVLLIIGTMFAGGGVVVYDQLAKHYLTKRLEQKLGFNATWSFSIGSNSQNQVMVVKSVSAGGAFEKAGFRKDDIIVSDRPPLELVRWLHDSRGQTVHISVVAGPTIKPLADCPQRQLSLTIP